jgi:GAF domain-containing protein
MANAELGALHRVATLAAEGVAPSDLFAVVAEEVSRVVDVPRVSVARYEADGTATDCASFPPGDPITSVDGRWSLAGTNVLGLVQSTCAPARIDDYSALDGEIAASVRSVGIRSTVGVPIVAAGRLWGAMMVSTRETDPLPQDTAARLAKFTELLATAIANAASREALRRLADKQAALRRVATLVARGVDSSEVLSAVAEQLAGVLGVQNAAVWRYEPDGAATLLADHDEPGAKKMPVGKRFTLEGDNIAAMVLHTGGTARMDTRDGATGSAAAEIRELGLRGGVGAPIIVAGRLWGAAIVGTSQSTPLPPDTELRVEDFAELVATAIANAATRAELQASRDELRAIADQQAALRRVATLVAREVAPMEVFSAVAGELARRLEVHHTTLFRYESDGAATLLAARHDGGLIEAAVGQRFSFQGDNLARLVFDTGRAARMDSHDNASGEAAAHIRQLGIRSAVGAPIIVGDRLWGVAIVGSSRLATFSRLFVQLNPFKDRAGHASSGIPRLSHGTAVG